MAQLATILVVTMFAVLGLLLAAGIVGSLATFAVTGLWSLVAGERVPLAYNLRNLVVRKTTTVATAIGVAFVVLVLAGGMMLSEGLERTMGKSGSPDTAIVLRKGSDAELASGIDVPNVGLVLAAPGVKKDDKGQPLGVGEMVVVIAKKKVGEDGLSNVLVRGVPDNVMKFRPEVRIVAGRPARPGTDEAIVGTRIRGRFEGVDLGQSLELRKGRTLTVVGVFDAGGASYESEVWCDLDTLRAAFGREGAVSSVRVKLTSASAFDGFAAYVQQDKALGFEAQREPEYYAKQSQWTLSFVGLLGNMIAFLFSLGAMIGAMITMYSSVSDRQREIGTLRALGFSRRAILFAFQVESLVLALVGGAIGALASLSLGLWHFSMVNFQTWSELAFHPEPTPRILVTALVGAAMMGLLGGFLPAIRAARVSAVKAMRG